MGTFPRIPEEFFGFRGLYATSDAVGSLCVENSGISVAILHESI
jgi:hypothetical protein